MILDDTNQYDVKDIHSHTAGWFRLHYKPIHFVYELTSITGMINNWKVKGRIQCDTTNVGASLDFLSSGWTGHDYQIPIKDDIVINTSEGSFKILTDTNINLHIIFRSSASSSSAVVSEYIDINSYTFAYDFYGNALTKSSQTLTDDKVIASTSVGASPISITFSPNFDWIEFELDLKDYLLSKWNY